MLRKWNSGSIASSGFSLLLCSALDMMAHPLHVPRPFRSLLSLSVRCDMNDLAQRARQNLKLPKGLWQPLWEHSQTLFKRNGNLAKSLATVNNIIADELFRRERAKGFRMVQIAKW